MMNFVLAFFLFAIIGVFQGYTVDKPIMGEITSDGAAQEAGLQEGDVVKAIDGESVSSWTDVVSKVVKHPGEEVTFDVERNGQAEEINVTPKSEKRGEETVGVIGVYQPVEKSFFGAIANGVTETLTWTKEIVLTLGKLVTGQFSIDMLSGPVGIYVSTEQVAQSGFYYLMKWAAALSINLGIVNLLPLPALDGGRLLFFLVEALRGKPIDRQKEGIVHFIGFALLMLLMLVVTWNDIQRFFVQ
jgi:regulator of sigma E protease